MMFLVTSEIHVVRKVSKVSKVRKRNARSNGVRILVELQRRSHTMRLLSLQSSLLEYAAASVSALTAATAVSETRSRWHTARES